MDIHEVNMAVVQDDGVNDYNALNVDRGSFKDVGKVLGEGATDA